MSRFEDMLDAVAQVLAHRLELKQRRVNGRITHYWVVCSCGYATEPGRSYKRHVASGIGHIQRATRELDPETRENLGVSLRGLLDTTGQNAA